MSTLPQAAANANGANLYDVPAQFFAEGLQCRSDNRTKLINWINDLLIDGVDYGQIRIKGKLSRPTLYKPDAEKIFGILSFTAVFPEDWRAYPKSSPKTLKT